MHFLFFILLFFFLFGCAAPKFERGACCDATLLIKNGTCKLIDDKGEDKSSLCNKCKTLYCAFADFYNETNETEYFIFSNGKISLLNCTNLSSSNISNPFHPCNNIGFCVLRNSSGNYSFPICSDREIIFFNPNCTAMFCGNLRFKPHRAISPDITKNVLYQNLKQDTFSINLYKASCFFYPLDQKTLRRLSKIDQIFINTFRVGVYDFSDHHSLADYQEVRWYFPLSDKFSDLAGPFLGTSILYKDRFTNYLNLSSPTSPIPSVWAAHFGESYYFSPLNPLNDFNNYSTCALNGSNQVPMLKNGSNYWFKKISVGSSFPRTYILPDTEKYKFFLHAAYWNELFTKPTKTASFECDSHLECITTICTKDDRAYERGLCEKHDGSFANCFCHEKGFYKDITTICEPYNYSNIFTPLTSTVIEAYEFDCCEDEDCYIGYCYIGYQTYTSPAPPILFKKIGDYIGYSFIDNFENSMLVKECNMIKGRDYETQVLAPPFYTDGVNDVACLNKNSRNKCTKSYRYFHLIKSLGNCRIENDKPIIKKVFGWCEASTLLTFIPLNMDAIYNVLHSSNNMACPRTARKDSGGPVLGYAQHCGPKIKAFIEEISQFREEIDNYLKIGVMPVAFFTDSNPIGYVYTPFYQVADDCKKVRPSDNEIAQRAKNVLVNNNWFPYFPDEGENFFTSAEVYAYRTKKKVSSRGGSCEVIEAEEKKSYEETFVNLDYDLNFENSYFLLLKKPAYDAFVGWRAYYPFLKRLIGNSASIIIAGKSSNPQKAHCFNERIREIRKQCPRCLLVLWIDSEISEFDLKNTYACYDAFAFSFEANNPEYVYSLPTTTEMYKSIFVTLINKSRFYLNKTGKPSLVLLTITDGYLWNREEDTFGFLKYLYQNQPELISAGVFGIIYLPYTGQKEKALQIDNLREKDEKFCAFQRATNMFLNTFQQKTVQLKVAAEQNFTSQNGSFLDVPECVKCTELEITSNSCNKTCLNYVLSNGIMSNVQCKEIPNYPLDKQKCPLTIIDSSAYPCLPCSKLFEFGKKIECNITYLDGVRKNLIIQNENDLSLYPDVIAALPHGQKCCLNSTIFNCCKGTAFNSSLTCSSYPCPNECSKVPLNACNSTYIIFADGKSVQCEVKNNMCEASFPCTVLENSTSCPLEKFSYLKLSIQGLAPTPILFPSTGDPNIDCGLVSSNTTFCGVEIPQKNYRIECVIK